MHVYEHTGEGEVAKSNARITHFTEQLWIRASLRLCTVSGFPRFTHTHTYSVYSINKHMHTNWRFPFHLSWPCQTWRPWGWSVRKWGTFAVLGLRMGVIWGESSKSGIKQQSEIGSPQGQLEIISGCKLPHSRSCRVESGAQSHCTLQHLLIKP